MGIRIFTLAILSMAVILQFSSCQSDWNCLVEGEGNEVVNSRAIPSD